MAAAIEIVRLGAQPAEVCLGGAVVARARIRLFPRTAYRPTSIDAVWLSIGYTEAASRRGASSGARVRRHFVLQRKLVCGARAISKPEQIAGYARWAIPFLAPPTYRGARHSVEWWVRAEVKIPYWPDLDERTRLVVHPKVSAFADASAVTPALRRAVHPRTQAAGKIEIAVDVHSIAAGRALAIRPAPFFEPGAEVSGYVILCAPKGSDGHEVWAELVFREEGAGATMERVAARALVWAGPFPAARAFHQRFRLRLPKDATPSHEGVVAKMQWWVRARVEIPFWFDPRAMARIVVLPRGLIPPQE